MRNTPSASLRLAGDWPPSEPKAASRFSGSVIDHHAGDRWPSPDPTGGLVEQAELNLATSLARNLLRPLGQPLLLGLLFRLERQLSLAGKTLGNRAEAACGGLLGTIGGTRSPGGEMLLPEVGGADGLLQVGQMRPVIGAFVDLGLAGRTDLNREYPLQFAPGPAGYAAQEGIEQLGLRHVGTDGAGTRVL